MRCAEARVVAPRTSHYGTPALDRADHARTMDSIGSNVGTCDTCLSSHRARRPQLKS